MAAMIYGLDTSFLVAAEIVSHPDHVVVRQSIDRLRRNSDQVAIAPQLLAEFIHVVTDPRRFANPLEVAAAIQIAIRWWTARDTVQVFPDERAIVLLLDWLQVLSLGRKRILDTMLAATYASAGLQSLLTTNIGDFVGFGSFSYIGFVAPGMT